MSAPVSAPASAPVAGRAAAPRAGRRGVRGFSLLEILVAFSIAALSLGMIYRVIGNNVRQTGDVAQHERAMLLAESLLATYHVVPPGGLREQGESAGYTWQVSTQPYPTPANADPKAVRLYQIDVGVAWTDGTRQRTYSVASLRPERLPEPGGRLP